LFGLFVENGPYTVEKDNTLSAKKYTWNSNYAMLFIDNPVGAGFSYTGTGQGYHHDQTGVSADLMELLRQFYVRTFWGLRDVDPRIYLIIMMALIRMNQPGRSSSRKPPTMTCAWVDQWQGSSPASHPHLL
jgi:hypothetical protein